MRVGFVGLGKLGLPVATCMAARGIEVYGYDPHVSAYPDDLSYEDGFDILAKQGRVNFCDLDTVVATCDPIFVAVQTPHDPRYEGVTPLPAERVDFDYTYLRTAAAEIRCAAEERGVEPTVAVISTVLPGTMEREIIPVLAPLPLVYNPSFIAMGTTIRDFLNPEFVLLGGDNGEIREIHEACGVDRFYETTIANAELIKVAYNTFISLKLAFANTLLEVCHKTGCDVDAVTGALKRADRRLISGAYLDGGMGDGGSCHPRDNSALSWLARELDLSYDIFEAAMLQRERQAEWLAGLLEGFPDLPKGILGVSYKPSSRLTAGSHAILVRELLTRRGHEVAAYDPHVHPGGKIPPGPRVWLVGCRHPEFADLTLPAGSVVIDPWRYIFDQDGVEVIRLGGAGAPAAGKKGER